MQAPLPFTRPARCLALGMFAVLTPAANIRGGEIGHFVPGVASIRDYTLPPPGFYGVVYNYGYTTDRLNDGNGDRVTSALLGLEVDVDVYVLAPGVIWSSDWKILGARYGAYVLPTFGNSSIAASLTTTTGNREAETSQFDAGDLFVQPIWLGWSLTNWDFALGYGFYAPVGRYNTETIVLPAGPVRVEAADNIGLGFWTHQVQGAACWYPWADKRLAAGGALTYEIHQEKEDFDLTPGQNLTLNWGISQYVPLKKDQTLLLELGPAGYSSWQITDDTGGDARNPGVHDEVHAVGAQLGLTIVPWNAVLNFHFFYELASKDRFKGQSVGLNFAVKF